MSLITWPDETALEDDKISRFYNVVDAFGRYLYVAQEFSNHHGPSRPFELKLVDDQGNHFLTVKRSNCWGLCCFGSKCKGNVRSKIHLIELNDGSNTLIPPKIECNNLQREWWTHGTNQAGLLAWRTQVSYFWWNRNWGHEGQRTFECIILSSKDR